MCGLASFIRDHIELVSQKLLAMIHSGSDQPRHANKAETLTASKDVLLDSSVVGDEIAALHPFLL